MPDFQQATRQRGDARGYLERELGGGGTEQLFVELRELTGENGLALGKGLRLENWRNTPNRCLWLLIMTYS
jgi:hypothetical protein